jgi:hypothetical protein
MRVEQQPENVRGRLVLTTIALAVLTSALSVLVAAWLLTEHAGRLRAIGAVPHFPMGETVGGIEQLPIDGPARGLLHAQAKRRALDRYAIIGPEREIARIPIARAMDWLVRDSQRGPLETPDPAVVVDAADGGRLHPSSR